MKIFLIVIMLTLPILPNLWCIWHARNHAFPGPDEQKLWIRTGVFVPVVGGLLYLVFGMRRARPFPDRTAVTPPEAGTGK